MGSPWLKCNTKHSKNSITSLIAQTSCAKPPLEDPYALGQDSEERTIGLTPEPRPCLTPYSTPYYQTPLFRQHVLDAPNIPLGPSLASLIPLAIPSDGPYHTQPQVHIIHGSRHVHTPRYIAFRSLPGELVPVQPHN